MVKVKRAGMKIPKIGTIQAFAMIVDLNQFTGMVRAAEEVGDIIAQFTRDCLGQLVEEVEAEGGEVVGFMGDAFYGVFPDGKSAVRACYGIAENIDRQCEYISNAQKGHEHLWAFAKGGPSVKIALEFGPLDISTISSRILGEQRLLVGNAVNYASRISAAGRGNRCIVGPKAAVMEFASYDLIGPKFISGKPGEAPFKYYFFSMADTWREGPRKRGEETFWG